MIDFFHSRQLPIVHILTVHKADGSTSDLWMKPHDRFAMVEGTADAEERPEVHTFDSDVVVRKMRHTAFIRTELEGVLRKIAVDAVVLVGFSTNACVGLTAIEAYETDFDVFLAQDAILGCDHPRADVMLKYLHDEFAIDPVTTSTIMARISAERTDGG